MYFYVHVLYVIEEIDIINKILNKNATTML